MKVYTAGCGHIPKIYGKKKLKALNAKSSFKDPTALAYFAQLNEMDSILQGRESPEWIDVIKDYTYPEVYDTFPSIEQNLTPGSCIAERLKEEGKQIGQDLLDEAFSIGDAILYSFRKNFF